MYFSPVPIFLLGPNILITASRTALGPIQPPIQWVLEALPGVKRQGREPNHSPLSRAVKNTWSYTSIPPICFNGVVLS
jgi:hypothetical protein